MAASKAARKGLCCMLSHARRVPPSCSNSLLSHAPPSCSNPTHLFHSPSLPSHSLPPLQNLPHLYSPRPSLYIHHRIPLWLLSSSASPLFLTFAASLLSQTSTPLCLPRDACLQGGMKGWIRTQVHERPGAGLGIADPLHKDQSTLLKVSWDNRLLFNWSNAISFGRLLSGPALAWMIMHGFLLEALVGLMIAGASDWLDGYIARKQGIDSIIGSYLDPVADKVLVGCIALSMASSGLLHPALVGIVIARDGTLIIGALFHRAHSIGWKCNSWREFFSIGEGGIEKMEPIFISKVNTVVQMSFIGSALLQPALGFTDSYSLIPSLSWCVAFTTCSSWLGYGFKYFQKPARIEPTFKPSNVSEKVN